MKYRAYCWRTGAIEISNGRTPRGAIKLFTFASRRAAVVANRVIEVRARHAYDGKTILIPGVPEAANDDAALDAVLAYVRFVSPEIVRRLPARAVVVEVAA